MIAIIGLRATSKWRTGFVKILSQNGIQKLLKNLRRNEMKAFYYATALKAEKQILKMIPLNSRVGVGGSVTIREMNLIGDLLRRGNEVYDHWKEGLSQKERMEVCRKQQRADVFLTSANALTMDGKILNIDATGNRVSSMIFGPSKVIVIAGVNKVVENVDEGFDRLKRIAAPKNCQRRKDPTPCAKDLICRDCHSGGRLCRVTTIMERRPLGIPEFIVILVGEEMGY